MLQINPYLSLNGKTREIMGFYKECLGGELTLQEIKDTPMANDFPPAVQDHIIHASFTKDNVLLLMASDISGCTTSVVPEVGNTFSLSLTCGSKEELSRLFKSLSAGGQQIREPHSFYAGYIAVLTDKFGISWMLYCTEE